jgi:hypothetical protein
MTSVRDQIVVPRGNAGIDHRHADASAVVIVPVATLGATSFDGAYPHGTRASDPRGT